jgi:hypothetical protein
MGWLLCCAVALAGCSAGTGGAAVNTEWAVRIVGARQVTLENGGEVTLTRCQLAVGPVYGFGRPPPQTTHFLKRLEGLLISTAYAHPDDFFAGGPVVAEWLEPRVIELSDEAQVLGPMPGIAGPLRSATLHLLAHPQLEQTALRIEGTVRAAGTSAAEPFTAAVALSGGFEDQRVDFIEAIGTLREGARITLQVSPADWFRGVKLDERARLPLDPNGQSATAIRLNLRKANSWKVVVDE